MRRPREPLRRQAYKRGAQANAELDGLVTSLFTVPLRTASRFLCSMETFWRFDVWKKVGLQYGKLVAN